MKRHSHALFDLSVLMDALNGHRSTNGDSQAILALAANGRIDGYICAAVVDNLHDLLTRAYDRPTAQRMLNELRRTLRIAPVTETVVDGALALGWVYLEDAITHECARINGIESVVSLNHGDFADAALPVYNPRELLAELDAPAA
jgi:predicted nucleic acid-binding protein